MRTSGKHTRLFSGHEHQKVALSGRRLLQTVNTDLHKSLSQIESLGGRAVTIFGSARASPGTPHYEAAATLAAQLVRRGYAIITGGGPGIMEAGNKGAQMEEGLSIGVNLRLPFENGNTFQSISLLHTTFATRKLIFLGFSDAFVVMPGGFGTLDELTEVLTHIQTGLSSRVPVILFDRAFWSPFVAFLKQSLLSNGYIKEQDLELFDVVDSPEEAISSIESLTSNRLAGIAA